MSGADAIKSAKGGRVMNPVERWEHLEAAYMTALRDSSGSKRMKRRVSRLNSAAFAACMRAFDEPQQTLIETPFYVDVVEARRSINCKVDRR